MALIGQLNPGQQLGKYRILSEIGQGGMGVVYLAEDERLGRQVALKVLPTELTSEAGFIERFRKEAKAIASMSHPNVVHLNAFDVIDGVPIIEMEYIDGGSLSDKLRGSGVTVHDAVRYAHGIISALCYCHALEAVHRDVKPSNILIDGTDRARLADFGLAKFVENVEAETVSKTLTGMFKGTPHYAPPEAWDGAQPSPAGDIYSLGVVMYEMLTGARPYESNTPLELAKLMATKVVGDVRDVNDGVSEDLNNLVSDMLRVDPADRIGDANDVRRRLEKTSEFRECQEDAGAQTLTTPIPVSPETRRQMRQLRKRPFPWRYLAAGVAVLALITGAFIWRLPTNAPSDGPVAQPDATKRPVALQDPAAMAPDMTADEFLGLSKGLTNGSYIVFDVEHHDEMPFASEAWLVHLSESGVPERIVLMNAAYLGLADIGEPSPKGWYAVSGQWANYLDSAGTVLRYGSLDGTIRFADDFTSAAGVLEYRQDQDGAVVTSAIVAAPATDSATDTRFLYDLERSDYMPNLIYGELLPRELAWAKVIDGFLPCMKDGVLTARQIDTEATPITVDGVLDEPVWQSGAALTGLPRSSKPTLRVAFDNEAVYLALSCESTGETGSLDLDVYLVTRCVVPQSAAPALHLSLHKGVAQATYGNGDQRLPTEAIDVVSIATGNPWRAEGRIALAAIDLERGQSPNTPWRLNAVLRRVSEASAPEVVARWGFPDEHATANGALIRFEE